MRGLVINDNNITVGSLEDGIALKYASNGSVTGNTIYGGGNGISFATSTNFVVSDNNINSSNYGIYIDASSTNISVGVNSYANILNVNVKSVYQIPQVNIIRNNAVQTGELGFTDTTCGQCFYNDPAGKFYFSDYQDTLGLYRGIGGLNANVKFQIDANQITMGDWGVKGKSLGVFAGNNLDYFPISAASYVNNGFSFGIGTTSPYAILSAVTPPGATTTTLFALASSTNGAATTTLFSVSNTGLITGQAFNFQGGTTSSLFVNGSTTIAGVLAVSGNAPSYINFASSTAFTAGNLFAGNATTTSLAITNIANGSLLKVNAQGSILAAVAGTDYLTGRLDFNFGTNNFATGTAATTTSISSQGVFFSSSTVAASQFPYASSTSLSVSGQSFLSGGFCHLPHPPYRFL